MGNSPYKRNAALIDNFPNGAEGTQEIASESCMVFLGFDKDN